MEALLETRRRGEDHASLAVHDHDVGALHAPDPLFQRLTVRTAPAPHGLDRVVADCVMDAEDALQRQARATTARQAGTHDAGKGGAVQEAPDNWTVGQRHVCSYL